MDRLIHALKRQWDVLPDMLGSDWPLLAPSLRQYLQYYDSATDGESRARVVRELDAFLAQEAPDLLYYLEEPAQSAPPPPPSPPAPPSPPRLDDLNTRGEWALPPLAHLGGNFDEGITRGMSTDDAPQTLIRYPGLEGPASTPLAQRVSVFFHLYREAPDADAVGVEIEDATPEGDPPEIEVVLRAPAFEIQGSNTTRLAVARDEDVEHRFVLVPKKVGMQVVRVDLYQNERRLGSLERHITVTEQVEETDMSRALTPMSTAPGGGAPGAGGFPMQITSPPAPAPDLELVITLDDNRRTLSFSVLSKRLGYHHTPAGSKDLQEAPADRAQRIFTTLSEFARLPAGADEAKREYARRRLESFGNELWDELVPDELKKAYWNSRSQVTTLLLTSDEPWIPWELLKPYRFDPETNEREDQPFLCETFAMARWLKGQGAPAALQLGSMLPVAPNKSNLQSVRDEVAFLAGLPQLESRLQVQEPVSKSGELVMRLEGQPRLLALHIAAHGRFDATLPNDSAITLDDNPFHASDLRVRFRPPHQPLVFINACDTGRAGFNFTKIGGWAQRLIGTAQIGAFIGAMWEVTDSLALTFTRAFYQAWLDPAEPASLAEAVRSARQAVKEEAPWNPTWLAYVLYADPHSMVNRLAAPPSGGGSRAPTGSWVAARPLLPADATIGRERPLRRALSSWRGTPGSRPPTCPRHTVRGAFCAMILPTKP